MTTIMFPREQLVAFRNLMIAHKRPEAVVILAYHRVCELTGLFYDRNVSVTPGGFRQQMEHVKKNYAAISMGKLADFYDGKADIPRNSIVITFDDGFKDAAENAAPVLNELGLPAMLFITTDFTENDYLPWEDEMAYLVNQIAAKDELGEIKSALKLDAGISDKDTLIFMICRNLRGMNVPQRRSVLSQLYVIAGASEKDVRSAALAAKKGMMAREDITHWMSSGLEIGSHTCSHPRLAGPIEAEVEKELVSSKRKLEEICRKEVFAFAYPYGMKSYYDKNSIRAVRKAGYKCAVSLLRGINTRRTDRFNLKRIAVGPNVPFRMACDGLA